MSDEYAEHDAQGGEDEESAEGHQEDSDEFRHRQSATGPLSNAAKERILSMHAEGHGIQDIAIEVGRSDRLVERFLEGQQQPKKRAKAKSKAKKPAAKPAPAAKKKPAAPKAAPARPAASKRAPAAGSMLEHRFWLRDGVAVTLSLPADLRQSEARRLAGMIQGLPFES